MMESGNNSLESRLRDCKYDTLTHGDLYHMNEELIEEYIGFMYFKQAHFFKNFSSKSLFPVFKKWLSHEDDMTLSLLAYLIRTILGGDEYKEFRLATWQELLMKIEDEDCLENLRDVILSEKQPNEDNT